MLSTQAGTRSDLGDKLEVRLFRDDGRDKHTSGEEIRCQSEAQHGRHKWNHLTSVQECGIVLQGSLNVDGKSTTNYQGLLGKSRPQVKCLPVSPMQSKVGTIITR